MPHVITLSRSKLYELVWSRPVTELAVEFGISDVAPAKRCQYIKIPLPPRGNWARVAAGRTRHRLAADIRNPALSRVLISRYTANQNPRLDPPRC